MTLTVRAEDDGARLPSQGTNLLELLEDAASGRGSVHFLASDPEPTPIRALWSASGDAARWISTKVGAGSTVASVLSNTRSCAIALLGAWRAGCTVASLPLPGRGMSAETYLEQLRRFCEAACVDVLMVDSAHKALVPAASVPVHAFDEVLSGGPPRALDGGGALVQFTSGSVGTPKGIHLTLDAVGANVAAILSALEPRSGDSSCSWLPLSHDMGLIGLFLAPIAAGAPRFGHHRLALMAPEMFIANPRSWLRNCSDVGATFTVVPNFALELAVRTAGRVGPLDLSRLRACIVGSESVRADTLRRFTETFVPSGFDRRSFCPAYGMAEATVAVTVVRPDQPWRSISPDSSDGNVVANAKPASELVSTGPPIDGVDVRVVSEGGAIGPIEVRSASLLDRYLGAELRLTADGYFPTRDLGMLESGELFVLGRSDEVIIVAGRNVYPADVEAAAVTEPRVRPGCVAAVEAPGGGVAIVAEPRAHGLPMAELTQASGRIRSAVARELGVGPVTVAFVPRGSLPKTPSGKLRRVSIKSALTQGDAVLTREDFA
jgi:acyl-CoA synthetase (AMP-forming)/AMP-acid ligase II